MATRAIDYGQAAVAMPPRGFVEQRSESRHEGLVEYATLCFRAQNLRVPVMIRFDGCSPLYAFVRWSRDGRLGLNFGCELTVG